MEIGFLKEVGGVTLMYTIRITPIREDLGIAPIQEVVENR